MSEWWPITTVLGNVLVGAVFVVSAIHKARDFPATIAAMSRYQIVRPRDASWIAPRLVAAEFLTAVGLCFQLQVAALVALLLLCLYTASVASAVIRHLDIDCHCGPETSVADFPTIARNVGLMLLVVPSAVGVKGDLTQPFVLILSGQMLTLALAARSLLVATKFDAA